MPFSQLVNEQQVEIVVAGPGDINRHYVCKGLAAGNFTVNTSAELGKPKRHLAVRSRPSTRFHAVPARNRHSRLRGPQ